MNFLTPDSHILHHVLRPNKKGGGVGCLINKSLRSEKQHTKSLKSFKRMKVQLLNERQIVIQNVIYRPTHSNFSFFVQEIECLILESDINKNYVIYLGRFNISVDDITNKNCSLH